MFIMDKKTFFDVALNQDSVHCMKNVLSELNATVGRKTS